MPQVVKLLISNAWEPELFASSALSVLTANTTHGKGPQATLGLSVSLNKKFESTPSLADPAKRSGRRASSQSPSGHQRHHSHSFRPSARSAITWKEAHSQYSTKQKGYRWREPPKYKAPPFKKQKKHTSQDISETKKVSFPIKGKGYKKHSK